ncbi:MAG: S8 family peptidase [Bacteroidota bacterium]
MYTKDATALKDSNIIVQAAWPKFVTAWVTLEQITQMAGWEHVTYIEAPTLDGLHNDVAGGVTGASLLYAGRVNNTPYKGKGVIAAIFDSGIDWDHPDYRDPVDQTKSRILRIWDQTLTATGAETPPAGFNYGVEYTQAQINDELDGTPAGFVREKDINGHGSHTSGTVAGNGSALASKKYAGMAPEADIVFIKGGDGSFTATNQLNALAYLQALATSLNKPVVLNMSIGSQTGAHDGTRNTEVAIDNFTASGPGRVVVISAGNDNGTLGHHRLNVAPNASGSVSFTVPSGTNSDVFRFNYFANDNSAVTATITAPDATSVSATAGQALSDAPIMGGNFNVDLDNLIDAGSGDRVVTVYIARTVAGSNPVGNWTLTISNNTSNALTIDGWMTYKNTTFANTAIVGGDNNMLVGSPGTATSAITAASYVGRVAGYSNAAPGAYIYTGSTTQDNISTFSAIGPRRDNVQKPDIAATGQAVISVLSSDITPPLSATNSNIIEIGLYQKNQGTSMAAPGVAGSVALLLQANPTATAAEIKNLLRNNTTKDAMTELPGATPNYTWGYGKLDIYKAMLSYFNCGPAERKTYQYDNSFTSATTGTGNSFTNNRLAVRFTADITGKMGGVFFHTSTTNTFTTLNVEVRTNNAGVPGTLLGSYAVTPSHISKYSWNYVDLSSLNVSITTATDYFVVLVPGAGSAWSLRSDNVAVDNRSTSSTDDGSTWTPAIVDYRIRPVVYNNAQLAGNIATLNSTDTRNINTSYQFINSNCQLIAQLVPNGEIASQVTGTVAARVWLEAGVPTHGGDPFVSRHYQLTPVTNTANATARVTLYFTQPEFTAFNNAPGSLLNIPANAGDAAGKANLRVSKYPGNSGDGSGLPASYTGTPQVLDPNDADIVWNAASSRWEVTINVAGFSGFFVQTSPFALPVNLEYFTDNKQGNANFLNWKVSCNNASARFEIERSADGSSFAGIGAINANQNQCASPFDFTDASPFAGNNYYRIKITENTGRVFYTGIVLLQNDKSIIGSLYPTLITKGAAVQVNFTGAKGQLKVADASGRQVYIHSLRNGSQSLSLPLEAKGVYFYSIASDDAMVSSGKIVVQ